MKIKRVATYGAKTLSLLLTFLLSISIGVAIYQVQKLSGYHLPKYIEIPITVLFLIVPTLLGLFNINLIPIVKKLNIIFESWFERLLKDLS